MFNASSATFAITQYARVSFHITLYSVYREAATRLGTARQVARAFCLGPSDGGRLRAV